MARLTPEHDALVVRLVYDGPPGSGKTTSVGSLGSGLASSVFSPAEVEGRTLYFDWLEYVGGSFDGIPIRCQILSVPGQPELAARRLALLSDADAIVFVTHSTAEHMPEAAARLRDLGEFLASRPSPRPGVVVQANQRDHPAALPLAELRSALGIDGMDGFALVESVAIENQGIRQAFILSVRLALDRARELRDQGTLQVGPGETDDPDALLAWLQAAEGAVPVAAAAEAPPPAEEPVAVPAEAADAAGAARSPFPRLPDSGTPGGQVWPPVDGRLVLHTATSAGAVPQRGQDGTWRFSHGGWHFHSAPQHEFEHLGDGMKELLGWAQKHTSGFERLSPQRCLALADTGGGAWRLWQVVRSEETLRQRLRAALRDSHPAGVIQLLLFCSERLLAARATFRFTPPLPCRLELIGNGRDHPVYTGLLPPMSWEPPADEESLSDVALLQREIQPLIEAARPIPPAVKDAWRAILAGA